MNVDYRKLFKGKWFTASELNGKDLEVTITKVTVETVKNQGGEEECPTIHFEQHAKPLVLNKTNAKLLAKRTGSNNVDDWVGKSVTLKESVTTFGGEEVPCVRVK